MNSQTHYLYPVVIEQTENNLSLYFPDFPGTAVTAVELAEGIGRARELLATRIIELEEAGGALPTPTPPEDIELEESSDRIVFLDVFMPPYQDAAANKSVTKNCTLPKWLRDAGDKAGLNYSLILQNGLKEALGISQHK
ncbi:MAG: HicB family protein [Paenibacillus sp.]|nr:HicB family protein [Paenibacillus sp.]